MEAKTKSPTAGMLYNMRITPDKTKQFPLRENRKPTGKQHSQDLPTMTKTEKE